MLFKNMIPVRNFQNTVGNNNINDYDTIISEMYGTFIPNKSSQR